MQVKRDDFSCNMLLQQDVIHGSIFNATVAISSSQASVLRDQNNGDKSFQEKCCQNVNDFGEFRRE